MESAAAWLPELHTWADRPTETDLSSLPNAPAVYLLLDAAGKPIQLATTQAIRRLLRARLLDATRPAEGKADVAAIARGVRWRRVSSPFESRWWYWRIARETYPRGYRDLISFGPAWFLTADWSAAIPEIRVSERVWTRPGEFFGPWPTRAAAQQALELLWDLFDLCRYPEQVRRAPRGQRCAYAEMGRCDAPCDGSVPMSPHAARCRAAWDFVQSDGAAWRRGATERMQQAAAARKYELAGQIKQQAAAVERFCRERPAMQRLAQEMRLALALRVARRKTWALFRFDAGTLHEGPAVAERKLAAELAAWSERAAPEGPTPEAEVRMEQTWLVADLLARRETETCIAIALPAAAESIGAEVERQLQEVRARRAIDETDASLSEPEEAPVDLAAPGAPPPDAPP